jgi:glycosyltransferase involved in cell wall biosynthesis
VFVERAVSAELGSAGEFCGERATPLACSLFESPVAVVMPVYNEAASIEGTVNEIGRTVISQHGHWRLFAFEDGSSDGTKEVLRRLESLHGWLKVSSSDRRKGYPLAARDAILYVDQQAFPNLVFLDSDGQYDPRDIEVLVRAMELGSPDIVVGKRKVRQEPMYRMLLSHGLYWTERLLFNPPCRDVTSAFRLMRTDVAQRIARRVKRSRFNFWLEFTARMTLERDRIIEVPISYRPRMGPSNVYRFGRMPHVIAQEFISLLGAWTDGRHT